MILGGGGGCDAASNCIPRSMRAFAWFCCAIASAAFRGGGGKNSEQPEINKQIMTINVLKILMSCIVQLKYEQSSGKLMIRAEVFYRNVESFEKTE